MAVEVMEELAEVMTVGNFKATVEVEISVVAAMAKEDEEDVVVDETFFTILMSAMSPVPFQT